MNYKVTSKSWDEVWEGSLDELFEHNEDLTPRLRDNLRALKPGESLDCCVLGVSYTVTCEGGLSLVSTSDVSTEESMARAIEVLLAELRQRGAWPSDIDVDLSGYETWRAAHPRQDA